MIVQAQKLYNNLNGFLTAENAGNTTFLCRKSVNLTTGGKYAASHRHKGRGEADGVASGYLYAHTGQETVAVKRPDPDPPAGH